MNRLACLAVAAALVFAGGSALAQLTPETVAVVEAASGQIIGAVATEPAQVPRLDDPQMARLFDLALPRTAMAADIVARPDEFALQLEVSAAAGRIARAYLLTGTGTGDVGRLSAEQRQAARRNFLAFLPEMERIYDFRLLACARLAEGVSAFLVDAPAPSGPGVDEGRQAIGREIRAVLAATISFVADPNIDEASRLQRMRLLSAKAESFSRFFDLKESETIADQALAAAIAEKNPEIADHLKDFALAILR